MNEDDSRLTKQSLDGDSTAFEELVSRNQDAVFNLVWRMTGNYHEAVDITQETFIQAYRKLHSYRPEFAFKNWVLSIGSNLTKNHFRSHSRRKRMEQTVADMQDLDPPPATGERDEELETALSRLPETLRTALVLKHMEGLSYEDIAHTLGIGVSAAKMRVARGRDELVLLLESVRERVQ